jgi:hypothetical protein
MHAAQQLRGSVGAWWATYTAALQDIPAGLMHHKK